MPTRKKPPEPTLKTVLERIDRQTSVIESLRVSVDTRFEKMEGSLDARFGEMQGSMDSRFGEMGVRVHSQTLLLEDMRAQNRATIEAVEASREALEEKIDTLTRDTNERIGVLDTANKHLAQTGGRQ